MHTHCISGHLVCVHSVGSTWESIDPQADTPCADTPHPLADMLPGQTLPCIGACWDRHPIPKMMLGYTHTPVNRQTPVKTLPSPLCGW